MLCFLVTQQTLLPFTQHCTVRLPHANLELMRHQLISFALLGIFLLQKIPTTILLCSVIDSCQFQLDFSCYKKSFALLSPPQGMEGRGLYLCMQCDWRARHAVSFVKLLGIVNIFPGMLAMSAFQMPKIVQYQGKVNPQVERGDNIWYSAKQLR